MNSNVMHCYAVECAISIVHCTTSVSTFISGPKSCKSVDELDRFEKRLWTDWSRPCDSLGDLKMSWDVGESGAQTDKADVYFHIIHKYNILFSSDVIVLYSTWFISSYSPRFALGGPPTPQVFFGSVLVRWWNLSSHVTRQPTQTKKTINISKMVQKIVFACFCSVVSLFSFKTHVIYTCLGIRSVQSIGFSSVVSICFNVFFENKAYNLQIYTFVGSKTLVFACVCGVFSAPTSQIPHFGPFVRCQKPPKTTQKCSSIPSWPPTHKNCPKNTKTPT